MPGFVRSPAEIADLRRLIERPRYVDAELVHLRVASRSAAIERLLPPPLEATGTAEFSVLIGRWRSTCVGDFAGAAIYVPASYEGREAYYNLTMFMDREPAILFGRDFRGEPKKQASFGTARQGDRIHCWVERHGVRLIDVRARFPEDLGPGTERSGRFNVDASLVADPGREPTDARLTWGEFESTWRTQRAGEGELVLTGTEHDPLHELEGSSVIGARFLEGDMEMSPVETLATIPSAAFLPYAYGRYDDWTRMSTAGLLPGGER